MYHESSTEFTINSGEDLNNGDYAITLKKSLNDTGLDTVRRLVLLAFDMLGDKTCK